MKDHFVSFNSRNLLQQIQCYSEANMRSNNKEKRVRLQVTTTSACAKIWEVIFYTALIINPNSIVHQNINCWPSIFVSVLVVSPPHIRRLPSFSLFTTLSPPTKIKLKLLLVKFLVFCIFINKSESVLTMLRVTIFL